MKVITTCVIVLALVIPARAQDEAVHRLTEIANGIYVAEPRFGGANATIIDAGDYVVVVDPHSDTATARALVAEIERLTGDPVRYVVNTHWHGDHHGGNAAFAEKYTGTVSFIAHPATHHDIVAEATPELRRMGGFYASWGDQAAAALDAGAFPDGSAISSGQRVAIAEYISDLEEFVASMATFEYILPDVLVESEVILDAGRRIVVRYVDGKAHTRGDVVVHVPDAKVLVTGDLLTAPYVVPRSGFPESYARVLREIASLDIDLYVLGHGGPTKSDTAFIEVMAEFLETAAGYARSQQEQGMDRATALQKAVTHPELMAFESRIDWEEPGLRFLDHAGLVTMTVERAFVELEEGR